MGLTQRLGCLVSASDSAVFRRRSDFWFGDSPSPEFSVTRVSKAEELGPLERASLVYLLKDYVSSCSGNDTG